MKRTGYLIERIADLDNLYEAYHKACRGKRFQSDVMDFGRSLNANLSKMRKDILTGDIPVGNYTYFTIVDPKLRTICAAAFPERVLHHAIMNVCHPYFDRTLISDTFATRPNKGIYMALDMVGSACKKHRYAAKLDVRKYFDSISHPILKEKLRRLFKDRALLNLFDRIIDSYAVAADNGLPIGNLTSQYFANYYLSAADHHIKERLRVPVYVRYMDDMLLFRDDMDKLHDDVENVIEIMDESSLQLKRPVFLPSYKGIPFLGYKSYPYKRLLERRSRIRFRRKMKLYADYLNADIWTQQEYAEHVVPLLAFVKQASSYRFRLSVMERAAIEGYQPRETRRQLEQQCEELPGVESEQQQPGQQEQQQRLPPCYVPLA